MIGGAIDKILGEGIKKLYQMNTGFIILSHTVKPRYIATRYSAIFTTVPVFIDHQIWRFTLYRC